VNEPIKAFAQPSARKRRGKRRDNGGAGINCVVLDAGEIDEFVIYVCRRLFVVEVVPDAAVGCARGRWK